MEVLPDPVEEPLDLRAAFPEAADGQRRRRRPIDPTSEAVTGLRIMKVHPVEFVGVLAEARGVPQPPHLLTEHSGLVGYRPATATNELQATLAAGDLATPV